MKITTLRAAARRHGLTVTKVTDEDPLEGEDGEVMLSNGVGVQVSACGTPVGVTGIVLIPEWTMFDKYWTQTPHTADEIMEEAHALRKRMDAHLAEHAKETSNV